MGSPVLADEAASFTKNSANFARVSTAARQILKFSAERTRHGAERELHHWKKS